MKKLLLTLILPALFILFIVGCASELDGDMPQGQSYQNGAAGQTRPYGAGAGADYARTERTDGTGGAAGTGNSGRTGTGAARVPDPGAGLQYDRGREDYPGQNYASLIGATVPRSDRNSDTVNAADNGPAGITGTQLSAGTGRLSNGSGLTLKSIRTPVRLGETGGLSAQGRPNTQYTITAVYRNADNMVTSTAVKRSDVNGMVELEWNVGRQTAPGTYGVMVSGGGEQITASYSVIE